MFLKKNKNLFKKNNFRKNFKFCSKYINISYKINLKYYLLIFY
ncbi:hypothetical protein TGUWTKB_5340 [Candidatus Tachikawaea gelatinosa]|uniref:Uncharacterized protein n=1 Tax=Candidatus Tachikawaea gelatinosa TaxID=1410383 RepID=A0A090ASB1_9ENTR|nr:hypothetical protein TGUWTKB_5340 [Candidatus Tachikawaea gelatinosa]